MLWFKHSNKLEFLYKIPVFGLFTGKIKKITENFMFLPSQTLGIARLYIKFPATKNREVTGN